MPRRDKIAPAPVVRKSRGGLFVGQVWKHTEKGWRFVAGKVKGTDFHGAPLAMLLSLNFHPVSFALNHLWSEAELRDNGFTPNGFKSARWVSTILQKIGAKMSESSKAELRASALRKKQQAAELAADGEKED